MTRTIRTPRRSLTALAGVLALTGLSVSACGSNDLPGSSSSESASTSASLAPGDPELVKALPERVAKDKRLIVGTDATYAPNEFLADDGKTVQGMDVDILNAVAAQFGVTVEYQPADFGAIILGVNSGKYDLGISSFTINDERKQQANMISYFNAGTQWATGAGNPKKVDPENACGLNVAVQADTVQVDDLTARSKKCTDAGKPAINQIVEQDQSKATADVVSGKADAMLADSPVGLYAVQQSGGKLEALGSIYDSAPYGIVVPKEQTAFAEALATALKNSEKDGSYKKALSTWGNESGAVTDFVVNP